MRVKQFVGVIAAAGCSLEILPKVDPLASDESAPTVRNRLMRMLEIALDLKIGVGAETSMARQSETLLDILIRNFADRLLTETRRGLPRAYRQREKDLPSLRGRLDVVRQFTTHAVRPDRLACRYDVLSSDIALMQIMKAAVVLLRKLARSTETQRRLDELRFVLADVADVATSGLPWERVHIDRTNRRWEALYRLARLLLKREWQATHHDARLENGLTLLFPMNDLFEAYVAALAARVLRGTGLSVHSQGGRLFCLTEEDGGRPRFQTRPDLLIKRGSETLKVIDTKWKCLSARRIDDEKQGISQADVYQMMAYGRLYDCRDLLLLYPYHAGLAGQTFPRAFSINNSKDWLSVATLDVTQTEAEVVSALSALLAEPSSWKNAA
nr:restriction endonuclease [Alteraurantiacibacter buctensis]